MHSVLISLLCIAWKKQSVYAQLSTLAWAACGITGDGMIQCVVFDNQIGEKT